MARQLACRLLGTVVLAGAALLAGCATSPGPSPVAVMGRDWSKATSVERPPANDATIAPQVGPHPQHFQGGQADLVAVTPGGPGFVAVGYLDPDIVADAWTSADGLTWDRIEAFPAVDGSLAAAVAAGPAGIVAVGNDGADAAAWFSADSATWSQAPAQASLSASPQIRMTSVVAVPDGFVATGYVGSLSGPVTAAFWRSSDGLAWDRIQDLPAFAGAKVNALAIVTGGEAAGRIVAVGAKGDAQRSTGAAAWVSDDGRDWRELSLPDADGAVPFALAAGPSLLVAVGNDVDSTVGAVWTSADGLAWMRAPADPALQNGGSKIELRAVTWAATEFVAGGHRNFGTQRGTAVIWTSPDGQAWSRVPETPALGEGKLFGMASGGARVIAVGSVGAPDLYLPTVWVSPPAP